MSNVLVVDDDVAIATLLADHLELAGHAVRVVHDGSQALKGQRANPASLLLLDVMLPKMSGLDLCRTIRNDAGPQPLILMLTARTTEEDSILGYEVGADDYIRKPFGVRELMARVQATLRVAERAASPSDRERRSAIVRGPLVIDPEARTVRVGSARIRLTPKEFDLLVHLAQRSGTAFSRERLLEDVWGYAHAGYARTIDSHITRVRKKLAEGGLPGNVLQAVHGIGYAFRETA